MMQQNQWRRSAARLPNQKGESRKEVAKIKNPPVAGFLLETGTGELDQ